MSASAKEIQAELKKLSNPKDAEFLQRFFKTAEGQYGHEDRLVALLMMVNLYDRGDEKLRERVYKAYLSNTDRINNWDLVDSSAPYIVGRHLMERSRKPLYRMAVSRSLWE